MATDFLGEMYGDRAIQAPFGMIVGKATTTADGVHRTMVGGLVIADFGGKQWQRWRGTVIIIPKMIDRARTECGNTISQMMTGYLGLETEETKRGRDSFWVPDWRGN